MTKLNAGPAEGHCRRGNTFLAQGQVQKAIYAFQTAIAVADRYPEAHYALAGAFARSGRWDDALTSYRRAVTLRPAYTEAYINMGNTLLMMNRAEEAITAFRAATDIHPVRPEAFYNLGNAYARAECWDEAIASFREAIVRRPANAEAHNNLGHILLKTGQTEEALAAFQSAVRLRADYAEAHCGLARLFAARGQWDEATVSYRDVLRLRPNDAAIHNELGNVFMATGRFDDACDAYGKAVAAKGDIAEAHYNLANVLVILERSVEAVASYQRALALQPDPPETSINMSVVLIDLGRFAEAVDICQRLVARDPAAAIRHHHLGNALVAAGQVDQAVAAYRRTLELKPVDLEVEFALANLLIGMPGCAEEAYALFRHVHGITPLQQRKGLTPNPAFSVLVFNAPGVANTPSDYLIGRANYDTHGAMVIDGLTHDCDLLRPHADVVVNLVSDADSARRFLPDLGRLIDEIGRPVVNHPLDIQNTSREAVARRLTHIPACRVPRTIRAGRDTFAADLNEALGAGFQFPVLVRACGAHGGDALEKADTPETATAAIKQISGTDFYITEYVPYESADGYFRKYRLFCVDGEWFPYHLAISKQWKVHHFRTDMANQDWMRNEEETFVTDHHVLFTPAHRAALQEIQSRINLDFFGIDCGITQAADLLVFEVNATMLLHEEKGIFSYKQPYVVRIKQAFDALLARKAGLSTVGP